MVVSLLYNTVETHKGKDSSCEQQGKAEDSSAGVTLVSAVVLSEAAESNVKDTNESSDVVSLSQPSVIKHVETHCTTVKDIIQEATGGVHSGKHKACSVKVSFQTSSAQIILPRSESPLFGNSSSKGHGQEKTTTNVKNSFRTSLESQEKIVHHTEQTSNDNVAVHGKTTSSRLRSTSAVKAKIINKKSDCVRQEQVVVDLQQGERELPGKNVETVGSGLKETSLLLSEETISLEHLEKEDEMIKNHTSKNADKEKVEPKFLPVNTLVTRKPRGRPRKMTYTSYRSQSRPSYEYAEFQIAISEKPNELETKKKCLIDSQVESTSDVEDTKTVEKEKSDEPDIVDKYYNNNLDEASGKYDEIPFDEPFDCSFYDSELATDESFPDFVEFGSERTINESDSSSDEGIQRTFGFRPIRRPTPNKKFKVKVDLNKQKVKRPKGNKNKKIKEQKEVLDLEGINKQENIKKTVESVQSELKGSGKITESTTKTDVQNILSQSNDLTLEPLDNTSESIEDKKRVQDVETDIENTIKGIKIFSYKKLYSGLSTLFGVLFQKNKFTSDTLKKDFILFQILRNFQKMPISRKCHMNLMN